MAYVMTVDQLGSRDHPDAVDPALAVLAGMDTTLGFERTAGDEFQGVPTDALSVVRAMIMIMDEATWHVGIGCGDIETPLPTSVRSGRGSAFLRARTAVDQAKRSGPVAVVGEDPAAAADATAAAQLLADLLQRRTEAGRAAVALARQGLTQQELADRLGITRQAVSQRLSAARWPLEQAATTMLAHLLERADPTTVDSTEPASTKKTVSTKKPDSTKSGRR